MKKIIKDLIKAIIATAILFGIIGICGNFIEWIFADNLRTGLFIGITGTMAIKLLFKMVSE